MWIGCRYVNAPPEGIQRCADPGTVPRCPQGYSCYPSPAHEGQERCFRVAPAEECDHGSAGFQNCRKTDADPSCFPTAMLDMTCDGLDDDCDGANDEDGLCGCEAGTNGTKCDCDGIADGLSCGTNRSCRDNQCTCAAGYRDCGEGRCIPLQRCCHCRQDETCCPPGSDCREPSWGMRPMASSASSASSANGVPSDIHRCQGAVPGIVDYFGAPRIAHADSDSAKQLCTEADYDALNGVQTKCYANKGQFVYWSKSTHWAKVSVLHAVTCLSAIDIAHCVRADAPP